MHNQNVRMEQLAASCHLANMDAVHFRTYVKILLNYTALLPF